MSADSHAELPNIALVLGELLQRVPPAQQALLIAYAERLAAVRYRDWSEAPEVAQRRADLHACAAREEEIASRIEGMFPDAAAVQAAIVKSNPDLLEINRTLFAGRPLGQQFRMQAQGERAGAGVWKAFASQDTDPARRDVFLSCADLEEANALVLESIV
jgi:hypothetical protein